MYTHACKIIQRELLERHTHCISTEKSHVRSHAKISCEILVRELLKSL